MALKLVTPPVAEPVSLAEAKLHLRVDIDEDNDLIAALIKSAMGHAEHVTRRVLITQTWELVLDEWPAGDSIEIPLPPLKSVESITYTDSSGISAVLDASVYHVDVDSEPGRVVLAYGQSWPAARLASAGAIRIRFVAGYGDAAAVPETIKQAGLLLIGHWYENREAVNVGNIVNEMPFAVDALLWPHRVLGWS